MTKQYYGLSDIGMVCFHADVIHAPTAFRLRWYQNHIQLLGQVARVVIVKIFVQEVLVDAYENKILACVINGMVKYIPTGDRYFLGLRRYHHIHVFTPCDFLPAL